MNPISTFSTFYFHIIFMEKRGNTALFTWSIPQNYKDILWQQIFATRQHLYKIKRKQTLKQDAA